MISMFRAIFLTLIFFAIYLAAAGQIPKSAVILEKAVVNPNRQLVLWMPNPKKNPRDNSEEIYTCPEQSRGHYYLGTAKVSLVNSKTNEVINTIEIDANASDDEANVLDLPYKIRRGYYNVPKLDKYKEGKPVIMKLSDLNNDGYPHEFPIFNALACMGLDTTLIGYSWKQDKVIQYPIELKTKDGVSKGYWADYLFGHKSDKKGVWRYQIDYRGRGGTLDKYTFRYDKNKEMFVGNLVSIAAE